MKSALMLTMLPVLACGTTTVIEYEGPSTISIYVPLPTPTRPPPIAEEMVTPDKVQEGTLLSPTPESFKEAIAKADVIAHVTLADSVTSRVETIKYPGKTYYSPALVFTFKVSNT